MAEPSRDDAARAGAAFRAWSLLHTGGMAQFQGNLGYTDRVDRFYEWDSTVANHARVQDGDLAVARDSNHLLGLGWVERIERQPGQPKVRRRCPNCGATDFKQRSSLRPPFRCGQCRSEFAQPREEQITVTRYVAHYGTSWWPAPSPVDARALGPAYLSRAAQHSIRELDPDRLRSLLADRSALPPPAWWSDEPDGQPEAPGPAPSEPPAASEPRHSTPHDPLIGTELGDYLIESRIGGGGMGTVYRATDLALSRPVALKVMLAHLLGDATARTRFQREIRHAAAIEHPHVIPVYNAGFEQGHFFIAMRLIEGPDLGSVLASGPMAPGRAIARFREVAAALQRVHARGLVHRDVKPQNILIADRETRDEYALLGDFGITRSLDSHTALTHGIIGTAEYMAPEVLRWQPAGPASDQYSLACVLFEMLAGRSPYHDMDLPAAHLDAPVPSLSEVTRTLPRPAATVVARAMSKQPEERFRDIAEFADAVLASVQPIPEIRQQRPAPVVRAPRRFTADDADAAPALHMEVAAVLQEHDNRWMTTREIARGINRRSRYRRSDGSAVTGSQVRTRAEAHSQLFEVNGTKVRLQDSGLERHPGSP